MLATQELLTLLNAYPMPDSGDTGMIKTQSLSSYSNGEGETRKLIMGYYNKSLSKVLGAQKDEIPPLLGRGREVAGVGE